MVFIRAVVLPFSEFRGDRSVNLTRQTHKTGETNRPPNETIQRNRLPVEGFQGKEKEKREEQEEEDGEPPWSWREETVPVLAGEAHIRVL